MTTQVHIVCTGGNHLVEVVTWAQVAGEPDREISRKVIGAGGCVSQYVYPGQKIEVVEGAQ